MYTSKVVQTTFTAIKKEDEMRRFGWSREVGWEGIWVEGKRGRGYWIEGGLGRGGLDGRKVGEVLERTDKI